ncbi:MAG: dCTP deaminase [Lachnospiraceae bacterium]|nr:dCTP deaminase [Lachnospiraceae bacterium]
MIYSNHDIREALKSGHIMIDSYNDDQIQPASIDLRLGNMFLIPKKADRANLSYHPEYNRTFNDKFVLWPGKFVLATTMEKISLPLDVSAKVEGRSSIGRLGLIIHTAGWIDPGFSGQITLELLNVGNSSIMLESGRRICQLIFEELKTPATVGYTGKYQNQKGTTGSRIYEDREIVLRAQHESYILANENVDSDNSADHEETITD